MEVRSVGQHDVPIGSVLEGGADQFGNQKSEGVGDEHLAGAGSNQWRNPITEPRRLPHPPRVVPTAHESPAPLVVDHLVDPSSNGDRHGTEGVAVEIDLAFVERELLAQWREDVGLVHPLAGVASDHRTDRTSHKAG